MMDEYKSVSKNRFICGVDAVKIAEQYAGVNHHSMNMIIPEPIRISSLPIPTHSRGLPGC
jgi:hypothetical protein